MVPHGYLFDPLMMPRSVQRAAGCVLEEVYPMPRVREAEAAALAAEELERLRIEEEARALEEQSERRIEEEAAPPADAAPISRQQSNLQQGGEDAPFAERIRALLGEDSPQTTQSVPGPTPAAKPGSNLPPLDPPVSIEDLITQDVGAPLVLPGAQ